MDGGVVDGAAMKLTAEEKARIRGENYRMDVVKYESRWVDDRARCDDCNIVKDRVIRRLPGCAKLCNECFEAKQ